MLLKIKTTQYNLLEKNYNNLVHPESDTDAELENFYIKSKVFFFILTFVFFF